MHTPTLLYVTPFLKNNIKMRRTFEVNEIPNSYYKSLIMLYTILVNKHIENEKGLRNQRDPYLLYILASFYTKILIESDSKNKKTPEVNEIPSS